MISKNGREVRLRNYAADARLAMKFEMRRNRSRQGNNRRPQLWSLPHGARIVGTEADPVRTHHRDHRDAVMSAATPAT
jgi:hypothetical protein